MSHYSHRGCKYHRTWYIWWWEDDDINKGKDKSVAKAYTFGYCNLLHNLELYIISGRIYICERKGRFALIRSPLFDRYWCCLFPFFSSHGCGPLFVGHDHGYMFIDMYIPMQNYLSTATATRAYLQLNKTKTVYRSIYFTSIFLL